MDERQHIARLLVSCPDRHGIVAAVSGFLSEADANILSSDQHSTDPEGGTFFMRMEFRLEGLRERRDELERAFAERVEEGQRIIEEAGGTLVGVYVTLGRYDVVEIFEAPDDELAVEILMKLQRFGAEHTETLRAFTRDEAEGIIRRL